MKFTIRISKTIITDVDHTIQWYESKEKGLGEKFENEFRTKITLIKENPKLFQEIETNHRRAIIGSSFPYTIHYSVNEKALTVTIISIFHQSKHIDFVNEQTRLELLQNIADRKELSQSRLMSLERAKNSKDRSRDKGLEL